MHPAHNQTFHVNLLSNYELLERELNVGETRLVTVITDDKESVAFLTVAHLRKELPHLKFSCEGYLSFPNATASMRVGVSYPVYLRGTELGRCSPIPSTVEARLEDSEPTLVGLSRPTPEPSLEDLPLTQVAPASLQAILTDPLPAGEGRYVGVDPHEAFREELAPPLKHVQLWYRPYPGTRMRVLVGPIYATMKVEGMSYAIVYIADRRVAVHGRVVAQIVYADVDLTQLVDPNPFMLYRGGTPATNETIIPVDNQFNSAILTDMLEFSPSVDGVRLG